MGSARGPKPRITYDGTTYTARRWHVEVPDLAAMDRLSALVWLVQNTTPTGYSRPKPNLSGINIVVR